MKIKLFSKKNNEITINLDQIKKQISELEVLFEQKFDFKDHFIKIQNNESLINPKYLIEIITLILSDLGYFVNFREIQNIIKKRNPNTEMEKFTYSLFEGLTMFWQSKKIIHQNNIFMLYRIINNAENVQFGTSLFRQNNNIIFKNLTFKLDVFDYNRVAASFNELIEFINDNEESMLPLIKMQIIHIHNLAISPFETYNVLFSKILSIWYLLSYGKVKDAEIMTIHDYLNTYYLNVDKYIRAINDSLNEENYTPFINFTLTSMIKISKDKNLIEHICHFLQQNKKIYLADYEKKILFMIIFHQMDEFD